MSDQDCQRRPDTYPFKVALIPLQLPVTALQLPMVRAQLLVLVFALPIIALQLLVVILQLPIAHLQPIDGGLLFPHATLEFIHAPLQLAHLDLVIRHHFLVTVGGRGTFATMARTHRMAAVDRIIVLRPRLIVIVLDQVAFVGHDGVALGRLGRGSAVVVLAAHARYAVARQHLTAQGALPRRIGSSLTGTGWTRGPAVTTGIGSHAGRGARPTGRSTPAAGGTAAPFDITVGKSGHATLELEEDVGGQRLESQIGQGRQLLAGLIALGVEVVLGQQVGGHLGLPRRRSRLVLPIGGLPSQQLVVDIGAQFLKLDRRQPQQFIAGPIGFAGGQLLVQGRGQVSLQDDVMLRQAVLHHRLFPPLSVHGEGGAIARARDGTGR